MSKKISIRFEPNSNVEFVGEDCLEKYEAAILQQVQAAYPDAEIELRDDASIGTQVRSYWDDTDDAWQEHLWEEEVESTVESILERIGNDLTNICA